MPKPRVIASAFFDDLRIAELTRDERLLVVAMVVACADDYGRLIAAPAYLRKQAFGYDEDVSIDQVAEMRGHILGKCQNIKVYQVNGQEYIRLCNWEKFQKIRYKVPSKLPPPPWESRDIDGDLPSNSQESNDNLPLDSPRAGQGRVEKSRVGKGRAEQEPAPPSADALAAPFPDPEPDSSSGPDPPDAAYGRYRERMVALWEEHYGKALSDQDAKQLVSWYNKYGTNTVWAAMQKALAANANNLGGYMRTVLESQHTRGP